MQHLTRLMFLIIVALLPAACTAEQVSNLAEPAASGTLQPTETQGPPLTVEVDETQMSGPVAVTVEEIEFLAEETVISVSYEGPAEGEWHHFGQPVLESDGELLEGREEPPQSLADGSRLAWHFPALTAKPATVVLRHTPLWLTVTEPVTLSLDLGTLRHEEQQVMVAGSTLSFALAPSPESLGFMLTYRPVDRASASLILDSPGEQAVLEDDLGNRYTIAGGNFDFDPDGDFALEEHALYTNEPLAEEAAVLTLHLERTGRITEGVTFAVDIP